MRTTGTRLDPILTDVLRRAAERRTIAPIAGLRAGLLPDLSRGARFVGSLARSGVAVIAECKRRSPSAGTIAAGVDPLEQARAYAAGGAAALSVLTEQDHFGAEPGDLERTAPAGLPRLRKDFLLDEGMVLESVAMGADAILLLAVCLDDAELRDLRATARECGLAVLLEVHDEAELERALPVEPDCIGVNARDLRTFEVDLATVERLLPKVPAGVVRVAESGIRGPAELLRARDAGADAVLVGEALMRSGDAAATLREWRRSLGRA